MSSIFISYSRKDLKVTEKIVSALAESKFDTWIDWKSIPKGEKFEGEIYQGIEGANIFLFLISPESVKSEWCKKELAHAVQNNKRIIPILIQDTGKRLIPIEVSERNWVNCRENQDDFNLAIKQILKTINTDYEWVKYHTKLQVRALDWENKKDNSQLLRGKELQEAEQQLASAGNKIDPQPTDKQRYYVLESRKHDVRRRRQVTAGLTIGFIIMSVLCVVAITSSFLANSRENARATAQAISEEQTSIALARQLATQARLLYNQQDNSLLVATLLAIESEKRFPNPEANDLIRNSMDLLLPIYKSIFTHHKNEIIDIAFSPDGKLIASSSLDNTVRIISIDSGTEIYILQHPSPVKEIRFNNDGKILYTISEDRYIYVWNTVDGTMVQDVFCGECSVISFTNYGDIIVANNQAGVISVWYPITNNNRTIIYTDTTVKSISISPDGEKIASLMEENLVKVWETKTGQLINQRYADAIFNTVVFSPNSQFIVSPGKQSSDLWDIYTGELITSFGRGKDGEVTYDFDPNGDFIATTGINSSIVMIWNAHTGELIKEIPHDFFISQIIYTPDSNYIITGSLEGVIKVWNLTTLQESGRSIISNEQLIIGHPNGNMIASVDSSNVIQILYTSSVKTKNILPYTGYGTNSKIDPTGKWIASWSENENIIYVVDIVNSTQVQIEIESQVNFVNFSNDGSLLISGEKDDKTCVWHVNSVKKITCYPQKSSIVAISSDLSTIAIAKNPDGLISIWSIEDGESIFSIQMNFAVTDIKFSPDNKYIAIGSLENYISLWDINLQKEKMQLPHNHFINSITFIPDTNLLVSSSKDGTSRVWDINGLTEISSILYNTEEFFNADNVIKTIISPDHTKLASVNAQAITSIHMSQETEAENKDVATIRIWDPTSGNEIIKLIHGSWVNDIIWSQDGEYILSGGEDGIVKIWDVANGNETGKIIHDTFITQLALSTNNEQIISLSDDGVYKISDLHPRDIIVQGCLHVTRNLSLSEWNQYIGSIPYQVTCENLPTPNN